MPAVISLIFTLLFALIRLAIWAIILSAVFSMLAAVNVIDTRNRLVWSIGEFLYRVTDPLLRPVRNLLPQFGAIDISPIVVILLLQWVVQPVLARMYGALLAHSWQPLVF